jgi:DNA-directed RNA polymerase specialized sigma24 family protein
MRHYEGMPIEEIGSVLGLKESATKNSIYRAVQKLRKELEPLIVASTPVGGRLAVPKQGAARG